MKKHTLSKALMSMNNGLFCGYPIHIMYFFVSSIQFMCELELSSEAHNHY